MPLDRPVASRICFILIIACVFSEIAFISDHTVSKVNDPVAALRSLYRMRYHDNALSLSVQFRKDVEHIDRILRVQSSCGLIRKEYLGIVDNASDNCDSLLLSAR